MIQKRWSSQKLRPRSPSECRSNTSRSYWLHFCNKDSQARRTRPSFVKVARCRFSTLMAHAAILTGGCPVFLITLAKAIFSFSWQTRQPYGCAVIDPWLRGALG